MVQGFDLNKKIKLTIDGSNVEEALQDYPILINLTDSSGLNDGDCSDAFDEFINDIATLPDGDVATVTDWSVSTGEFNISDKKIYFDCTASGTNKNKCTIATINGDFRFMTNVTMYGVGLTNSVAGIQIKHVGSGNFYRVVRTHDTSIKFRRYDPDYTLIEGDSTTATSFELYIHRNGSTVNAYYRTSTASTMTLLSTITIPFYEGDWEIALVAEDSSTTILSEGYFYNMTLQSWQNKLAVEYVGHETYEAPITGDAFSGAEGDPPDPELWSVAGVDGDDVVEIQNNTLYMYLESDTYHTVYSNFIIEGDFDIEVNSTTNVGMTGSTSINQFMLKSMTDSTAYLFAGQGNVSNSDVLYDRFQVPGSVSLNDITTSTSNNYGIMRISRLGTRITVRHKTGNTTWVTTRLHEEWCDHDIRVSFENYKSDPNITLAVNLKNFKINHADGIRWKDGFNEVTKTITAPAIQQCYCEIERWDCANRSAQIWVKVPQIAAGTDTVLNLYYDKDADDNNIYVGDIGSSPGMSVWSNGYSAVYHLGAFYRDVDTFKDSVWGGSRINLSSYSMGYSNNVDSGHVGRAQDIYNADYLYATNNDALQLTGNQHIEFFMKAVNGTTRSNPLHKAYGGSLSFTFEVAGHLTSYMGRSGSDGGEYDSMTFSGNWGNTWAQITRSFYSESLAWRGFGNGVLKTKDHYKYDTIVASTASLLIGKGYTSDDFQGLIRNVRLSKAARSVAWSKFTYFNEMDQSMTYKKEQFNFEGTVKVKGTSAQRWALLYRRDTGELIDKVLSEPDGTFNLIAPTDEYYFVVVLPDIGDDYNIIPYDKIKPII